MLVDKIKWAREAYNNIMKVKCIKISMKTKKMEEINEYKVALIEID